MVQGRDGPGLAVEAFEAGGVFELLDGEHLEGDEPPHEGVFAQVDGAHAAGADEFEQPVLRPDGEPLVPAELELLGLEEGEQALADEQGGELVDARGQGAGGPVPVEQLVEPLVRDQPAAADQVEELGHVRGCRHRLVSSSRVPVRSPTGGRS